MLEEHEYSSFWKIISLYRKVKTKLAFFDEFIHTVLVPSLRCLGRWQFKTLFSSCWLFCHVIQIKVLYTMSHIHPFKHTFIQFFSITQRRHQIHEVMVMFLIVASVLGGRGNAFSQTANKEYGFHLFLYEDMHPSLQIQPNSQLAVCFFGGHVHFICFLFHCRRWMSIYQTMKSCVWSETSEPVWTTGL